MIPDRMVDAASRRYMDFNYSGPNRNKAMCHALEAAGVGELIEALKPFAVRGRFDAHKNDTARSVLEKLGVKL